MEGLVETEAAREQFKEQKATVIATMATVFFDASFLRVAQVLCSFHLAVDVAGGKSA